MPTITKIRFANVIYEQGSKRYHDETFQFNTHNGAILLENGGGKTVFIQAAMQAIIPHATVANRQIKETFYLEEGPAHIAIEWLLNERPRQYVVTAVTLYTKNNKVESLRYVYEYGEGDKHAIDAIPFTKREAGMQYPASKDDMQLYFQGIVQQTPMRAKLFPQSIKAFTDYLESNYFIIREEWENMVVMNSAEGGIEKVFEECKGTQELFDRLLIPSVENADKHFNPLSMADQFEKQRSNLKKYKEFNEKKIEYYAMQERMEQYVHKFRVYNDALVNYREQQQQAVAYVHYLQQQREQAEKDVKLIEEQLADLKNVQQQLVQRQQALTIYKEQDKQRQLQEELIVAEEKFNQIESKLKVRQLDKASLEYAIDAEKLKQAEETIAHARVLLQQENEKEDIDDLQNELELYKGQWLYLLEVKKEKLQNKLAATTRDIQKLKNEELEITSNLEKTREDMQEASKRVTKNDTLIQEKSKQLTQLKRKLVAHENEQVEDLLKQWIGRATQLEQTSHEHEKHLKVLEQQAVEQQQMSKLLVEKQVDLEKKISVLDHQLQSFEEEEASVKARLQTILHQMSMTARIYDRAMSYTNQLQEKITQLQADHAEKLVVERKARRYLDDYGGQSQFFAEPYLAEQIQHWSQFTHIQTGVDYLQSLEEAIDVQHIAYPFWAITLITTANERQALIDKVHVLADKLTTPIVVLTREEAKQLVQGEPFDEAWIAPLFWREHVDKSAFLQWKQSATAEASFVEKERKEIEKKLSDVEQAYTTLTTFLEKYPYEHFKQLNEQHFEAKEAHSKAAYDLRQVEQKIAETETTKKQIEQLLQQEKEELRNLNFERIPNAQEYQHVHKQIEPLQAQRKIDEVEVTRLVQVVQQLSQNKDNLQQQWLDMTSEKLNIEHSIMHEIEQHEIYQQRAALTARATTLSEHALKLEVTRIEEALKKMSATIQQLQERIDTHEKLVRDYRDSLERKLAEHPALDKQIALPVQPEGMLKQLQQEMNRLIAAKVEPLSAVEQKKEALQSLKGSIQTLIAQYEGELPARTASIEELQQELQIDFERYEQKLTYTKSEYTRINKQAKNLALAEGQSKDSYFRHQLNKIKQIPSLSTEQQIAFLYEYEKELKQIFVKLDTNLKELQSQQQMMDKEKQQFRQFCTTLQDHKLSKVTMDGIENHHTYKAIMEHQQLINQTIQQAIHLADAAIQEYDKDQQQIIQYAVQQLVRIRHNLLEIPKKTRIRTENETKYMYQFIIPEWEEHEAKDAIRDYINWILTTLEQDKYRDEYGNEDVASIRKFLEKHLQTVPLLHQVLGNKKMQVKCRKVESERQISSNFYSWEQSNKWSGGESWSKNMALYLGILKFIAEKSGGPMNTKRNRALILDNPFGKASSDHVLSPVFYIAEQLGFQMIALTAHAEGKYIADYFPVVYSCRLRSVRNASHQVVQKEQQLNKAFFADNQPEALHYVGERKQMTLFEDE
ncbi:hypothetical protein R6U77_10155 [Lysinibacillus louembei]|uniref:Chromosome segregation ATPase n=1 Tax=Lysinibacillus louembei TaxID=1470088 RepID=A0ABZ0RTK1_9BACI|nr:hypothetical protein [Lysinibacillus louembei]WPK10298.1 hypothetical protein R6U77_10155 [Lysinibacillus louembei]